MDDWPVVNARRFETSVRWSTYAVIVTPLITLAVGIATNDVILRAHRPAAIASLVLGLVLILVNVLVVRWSFRRTTGSREGLPWWAVGGWTVLLAGFVAVAITIPLQTMSFTVASAIGSVAASLVPALRARHVLLLNLGFVALAASLAWLLDPVLLIVGAALITVAMWASWSGVWTLGVLRELQGAHQDRAALGLATERLRISRDLHDVFGRTLATISVKSELASELVRRGQDERASAELAAIRSLADDAGTEVRRVVRSELRPTWEGELAGARSLLGSAGIRCTVSGDTVPAAAAETLAWVVREGVTNVLRHSAASEVTIVTAVTDGEARLTITNDGAGAHALSDGTGLRAMSARIEALGGDVLHRRDGAQFVLEAVIPEGAHT